MKRVIKFLPIAAIVLGSGLAVATTSVVSTPNVYWNGSSWQPLSGSYTCTTAPETPCVAHKAPNGAISNVQYGDFAQ